jgi:hypothetical protein
MLQSQKPLLAVFDFELQILSRRYLFPNWYRFLDIYGLGWSGTELACQHSIVPYTFSNLVDTIRIERINGILSG